MLVKYVPAAPTKKKIIFLSLCIVVFLKKTSVISVKSSKLWTPAQGHATLALTFSPPALTVIKGRDPYSGEETGYVNATLYPRISSNPVANAAVGTVRNCIGLKVPYGQIVSTRYITPIPARRDSEIENLPSPASPYANQIASMKNDISTRYSTDNAQSPMNSGLT